MSINRVIISGNLTREPEIRSTAAGKAVLGFGMAVNDRRRNPTTGEWEDYPNYVDCTMFGSRAESVGKYMSKGSKVCVEGKLRWSQWERDGQRRTKLEVVVDDIELMSARQDGGQRPAPRAEPTPESDLRSMQAEQPAPAGEAVQPELYGEDVEF